MSADSAEVDSCCEIMGIQDATVAQIDAALVKISEGSYGVCEACAKPIPRARLEAIPFASLCVECQRSVELREEGFLRPTNGSPRPAIGEES
jgi:RNA polymerase-binding transcription factor DksA